MIAVFLLSRLLAWVCLLSVSTQHTCATRCAMRTPLPPNTRENNTHSPLVLSLPRASATAPELLDSLPAVACDAFAGI